MQITVTLPSGETATVDQGALALPDGARILAPGTTPEGFVTTEFFEAEVKRRSKDAKALRRELAGDPDTVRAVLEAAGVAVDAEGKPAIPNVSDAVQTARQKWEAEQLKPVQDSYEGLQSALAQQALLAASKGVVRDEFTARIGDGPSYVETLLGGRTRYDADLGYTVALGPDGSPLPSANPKPGRPYADAAEFVTAFVASDEGAALRPPDPKAQTGPGYRGASATAGGVKRSTMDVAQKAAFVREHGQEAFQNLPD